jgi:hypothetical protein
VQQEAAAVRREREQKPSLRISKKDLSIQQTHIPVVIWVSKVRIELSSEARTAALDRPAKREAAHTSRK